MLLAGVCALACAPAPTAPDPSLAAALATAATAAELDVIVMLAGRPPLPGRASVLRGERRRQLIEQLQASHAAALDRIGDALAVDPPLALTPLWLAGGVALTARPALIQALLDHPAVESIRLDRRFHRPLPVLLRPPPGRPVPGVGVWNLDAIHTSALWRAEVDGSGVVVANLDTGVDVDHPDLAARWRGGSNSWFDPAAEHATPADVDGHGTQTMGIAVGGASSGTPIGVAPGARWIAAKIYDDSGSTTLSAIHRSLQWLLDPDGDPASDDAPDVVNNSWGIEDQPDACVLDFAPDLAALRAAGILMVFAAGNAGPEAASSVSPANNPGALAIGAVDAQLLVLGSSSRGPSACGDDVFPTLVAPGVDVRTADLTYGGVFLQSYASVDGTSFAAPHVTGAAALLLEACPTAAVEDLEQALIAAAVDLGGADADRDHGHGLIDLAAARDRLLARPACGGSADAGVVDSGSADAGVVDSGSADHSGDDGSIEAAGGCAASDGDPRLAASALLLIGALARRHDRKRS